MAQIKTGDTVRFLNDVGGGTVSRIEGNMAYVSDDDGFERPVPVRECVAVGRAEPKAQKAAAAPAPHTAAPAVVKAAPAPQPVPEEVPGGDRLNVVIGFEPADIRRLGTTTFDATLVNDSNYYLQYTVATRGSDDREWHLRAAGCLEPGMQDFMFELTPDELPRLDRLSFQAIAYKQGRDYELKAPVVYERKVDATKFVRLHCFRPDKYFDTPVISIDIMRDDRPAGTPAEVPSEDLRRALREKTRPGADKPRRSEPRRKPADEILEVDLHATELLDTTAGMSASEILNYQIDYFRRIMDENLRTPGRRIVFIHGNGDGVLRKALQKELNYRYKGHDVADASFREYGFGATMVTIRNVRR